MSKKEKRKRFQGFRPGKSLILFINQHCKYRERQREEREKQRHREMETERKEEKEN